MQIFAWNGERSNAGPAALRGAASLGYQMCTELLAALFITLNAHGVSSALEQEEREHAACMFAHHCTPIGSPEEDGVCYETRIKAKQPRLTDKR